MGKSPQHICTLFAFASHEPVKKERSALSWLSPSKRQAEKEGDFIETLCDRVYHLPTVYAATQTVPELGDIPIKPSEYDAQAVGLYDKGQIEIGVKNTKSEWLDVQTATLPHELRHGYHDIAGCLTPGQAGGDVFDYMFCTRFTEADATVFSLATLYEHGLTSGDYKPLEALRAEHPEMVDAYMAGMDENEEAHWNGDAANAAFAAYFANDDKGYLKNHDMHICEHFFDVVNNHPDRNPEAGIDRQKLRESMSPLASMPYMNDLGNIKQRPNDRPQDTGYDVIMGHISPEVEAYIQSRKSAPAPKLA